MNILILGCGQIGQALAMQLSREHKVTAISRTAKHFENFRHNQQNIHALRLDYHDPIDWVYVILTPDQRTIENYQDIFIKSAEPVFHALKPHPIQRIVFISSTRVYGEDNGQVINDQTIPHTHDVFGQSLIEAEQTWRSLWQEKLIIIRPSGLYLENSAYLTRLAQNTTTIEKLHWSNRAHRSDLVGFLKFMLGLDHLHNSYLLSDSRPTLQHEIINLIRKRDHLDILDIPQNLPVTGKKIYANHLITSGYQLLHPYFDVKSTP